MYQLTVNILRDGEMLFAGKRMTTEEIGGDEIVRRWLQHGMCVLVEADAGALVALPAGEPTPEAVG